MGKMLTKEEAVAMLIKRFAVDSTDRLFIEAACAMIYEYGVWDGLLRAYWRLMKVNEDITGASCTGVTRSCPCPTCRSVRAVEEQNKYDHGKMAPWE